MNEQHVNEITDRLCSDISYNTSVGSFARDIMRSIAIEFSSESENYNVQLDTRFIDTATGVDLEICAIDKGKEKIKATYAVGDVKITGLNGTVIPEGVLIENTTTGVIYETIEEKQINNISTIVKVISLTPGTISNCQAGQLTKFKEIYPGLTAVTNEAEITGAIDDETDEQFRNRLLEYIQKPQISWNKYVFEAEAKVIREVDKTKCIPIGGGSVKLIITEKDNIVATQEVKNKVKNYIENKIISDINLTVEGVSPLGVSISIEAELNQDFNNETAKVEIKNELNSFFFNKLFETRILYFDIADIIQSCKSIIKISDLKINNTKDDLIITEEKLITVNNIQIGGIE